MSYENEAPPGGDDDTTPDPSDRTAPGPDGFTKTARPGAAEDIIEPGQTEEFNFRKFQELAPDDVPCDAPEESDEPIVCPSCIPDPDWTPDFNWRIDALDSFSNIYLDEATCEYVMITEEAIADTSGFRALGLSTLAFMVGDEPIFTTPETDHTRDRDKGADLRVEGDDLGKFDLDGRGLTAYNNTGCTPEDNEEEQSNKAGACQTWHDRVDGYKAHAVREIMFHYSKLVTDETYIAMFSVANPDGLYEDGVDWFLDPARTHSSLVRVRVAIPAQLFDNLPPAEPEDAADIKSPVESVVLKAYDINKKVDRLRKAFQIYGKYQAYWYHTDGGKLFQDFGEGVVRPIYLDTKDDNNHNLYLERFEIRLKEFLNDADYKFGEGLGGLFKLDTIAYEVKLEFDEEMKISAVYARKSGCDFELLGGIKSDGSFRQLNKSSFKYLRRNTGRMTGYLIAKIHEIDHDLRAREPMPWLDFIAQYTYPALKVDYGAGLPQQSMLGCFLEGEGYGEFFDCILDQIISLPDVLAYKFQEFGCELIEKNQKVAVESAEAKYEAKKKLREQNKKINEAIAEAQDTVEAASDKREQRFDEGRDREKAADAATEAFEGYDLESEIAGDLAFYTDYAYNQLLREDAGLSRDQLIEKYSATGRHSLGSWTNPDGSAATEFDEQILAARAAMAETRARSSEHFKAAEQRRRDEQDALFDEGVRTEVAADTAGDLWQGARDAQTEAEGELKEAQTAKEEAMAEFKSMKKRIADAAQTKMERNAKDALKEAGIDEDRYWGGVADDAKKSYKEFTNFLKSSDLAKEAESIKDWKKTSCGVFPRDGDLIDQALPGWLRNIIEGKKGSGLTMYAKLYKNVFSRLTFCGLLGLMMAGLECIFAGLSFADAMMIMIKAAFKEMPPYSLGKLFIGLPVDKQLAIEEKVKKQLKELNMSSFVDMKSVMAANQKMQGGAAADLAQEQADEMLKEVEDLKNQFAAGTITKEVHDRKVDDLNSRLERGTEWLQEQNENVAENMRKTMDPANASGVDSQGNPTGGAGASSDKTLGKTTGDIIAPILKAYVDAIIEIYSENPEELLEELNKIPGAALIARTLLLTRCPRAPLFHPPIFDFLKGFDFKFCTNGKVPIMPAMRPIDWVSWKYLIKYLVKKAIEEILALAEKLLLLIVIKIFQSVYNAICKLMQTGVNIAATSVANAIKGESTDVYRILVESFCGPQPDPEEVAGVLTDIFAASGASISPAGGAPGAGQYIGQQSIIDSERDGEAGPGADAYGRAADNDVVDFMKTIFSDLNQKEAIDLIGGRSTPDTIQAVANLAKINPNPAIQNFGTNPDNIAETFRNISVILPEGAIAKVDELQNQLEAEDLLLPLNSSFCASDKEVDDFYEAMKLNVADRASPEQAANLARARYDEQVKLAQDLGDLISGPMINPSDFPRVFEQPDPKKSRTDPDDPCAGTGDGMPDSLLPREPAEITALSDDAVNKMFDAIEAAYTRDLMGTRGIFNWVLTDSIGVPYLRHVQKVDNIQKYVNSRQEVEYYLDMVNSIDDKDSKEAATIAIFGEKKINKREAKKLLEKSTGYLPKTIGMHLRKIFDNFSPAGSTMDVLGGDVESPKGVDVEVALTTEVNSTKYIYTRDLRDPDELKEKNINIFTNKYTSKYIADKANKRFIESSPAGSITGKYSLAESTICAMVSEDLLEASLDLDAAQQKAGNDGYTFGSIGQVEEAHEELNELEMVVMEPSRKKTDLKLTFKDRNFENAFTNDKKDLCDWAVKFNIQTALFDAINDENGDPYILDPGDDGDIGQIYVSATFDTRAKAGDEMAELFEDKKKKKKKTDDEARDGPHEIDAYSTNKFLCIHSKEVEDYLIDLDITSKAPTKPPMHTAFCAMLENSIKYYNDTNEVSGIDYTSVSNNFFREEDYSSLLTSMINGFMKPLGKKNKDAWLYGYNPRKAIIDPRSFEFGIKNKKYSGDDPSSYDDYRNEFKEGEFRPMHRAERRAKTMPITRYEYDTGKPHPRVHLLDPAQYGGSYNNPPIYIEPYVRDGWLGILDKLVPEWDACKPRKADLINLEDIKQRVQDLNSRIPDDERLSFDEGCLVEEPYARILNRFSAAAMEGAVKSIIRLVISEHFLNAISSFTTFKLTGDNFDEGFASFILSNVEYAIKDKSTASGFLFGGGGLSTQEYWYAFLEMCVQIWNRQYAVLEEIPEEEAPAQLTNALEQLNDIIERYANPNSMHQLNRNDIWPRNRDHLSAAKGRGEIGFFGTLKKLRRQRNLTIVAKTEHLASIFALELIKQEMKFFSDRIENTLGVKFKFDNISQYFLDNLCIGNTNSYDNLFDVTGQAVANKLNWFEGTSKFNSKIHQYEEIPGTPTTDPGPPATSTAGPSTWERSTTNANKSGATTHPFQTLYDQYFGTIFLSQDEIVDLESLADEQRAIISDIEKAIDDIQDEKKEYKDEKMTASFWEEDGWRGMDDEALQKAQEEDEAWQKFNDDIAAQQELLFEPNQTLDGIEDQIDSKEDLISDTKSMIKELLEKVKQGGFVLQRYAIIKDRNEILAAEGISDADPRWHDFDLELPEYVTNRANKFRGFVSMEAFKEFFGSWPEDQKEVTNPDGTTRPVKFSDYFSTFEYVYDVQVSLLGEFSADIEGIEDFLGATLDLEATTSVAIPARLIPPEMVEEELEPVGLTGKMGIEFGLRNAYFPSETRGPGAWSLLVGTDSLTAGSHSSADMSDAVDATQGSGIMKNYPEMIEKAQKEYALAVAPFFTRDFHDRGLKHNGQPPPEEWEHNNIFENTDARTYYLNTSLMIPIDDVRRYLVDIDIEAPSVDALADAGFEDMEMTQDLVSQLEEINVEAEDSGGATMSEEEYHEVLHNELAAQWGVETAADRYEALLKGYGTMEGAYDLPCLRDEFSKKASMKILTEYVLKLKRLTSMAAIYNSIAFPWSILQVSGDPDQVAKGKKELIRKFNNGAKKEKWKKWTYGFFGYRGIFTRKFENKGMQFLQGDRPYRNSLNLLKKLFVSLYNDRDFIDPDDGGGGGPASFKELLKGMFGPNVDGSMRWWNRTRRRPFDANGDDCKTKLL